MMNWLAVLTLPFCVCAEPDSNDIWNDIAQAEGVYVGVVDRIIPLRDGKPVPGYPDLEAVGFLQGWIPVEDASSEGWMENVQEALVCSPPNVSIKGRIVSWC